MLRIVIFSSLFGLACATNAVADDTKDFAPGAQGSIQAPVGSLLEEGKSLGRAWRESLDILKPDDFGTSVDFDVLRKSALDNPRVRALLGADPVEGDGPPVRGEAKYGNSQIFLFASFSMPPNSLRSIMVESERFNVPILMRGFVDNSVFKTQEALVRVFGEQADTIGFNIDPTAFTRFGVETVPKIVVVAEALDVCTSEGCLNEDPIEYDIIGGNIPLEESLRIIAAGDGEASLIAQAALENANE